MENHGKIMELCFWISVGTLVISWRWKLLQARKELTQNVGKFCMLFCCLLIVSKSSFSKNSFRNSTRVLNHWIQIRTNISELGSNYLLNKPVDNENHWQQVKHVWKLCMLFCRLLIFFIIIFFKKNLSGIASGWQTAWIQIRSVILSAWSGFSLFAKVISRHHWQVNS